MKFKPKLVLTDIDGVWTDGGMYYDETGNEWKKFSTYDAAGVKLCKKFNIPVGIITGENTEIVKRRAKKLCIDYLYQGAKNKVEIANTLCEKLNISIKDVAYIGDDTNDIDLLKVVGFSGAPANATKQVKSFTNIITKKAGGNGAFREFVETIFNIDN